MAVYMIEIFSVPSVPSPAQLVFAQILNYSYTREFLQIKRSDYGCAVIGNDRHIFDVPKSVYLPLFNVIKLGIGIDPVPQLGLVSGSIGYVINNELYYFLICVDDSSGFIEIKPVKK